MSTSEAKSDHRPAAIIGLRSVIWLRWIIRPRPVVAAVVTALMPMMVTPVLGTNFGLARHALYFQASVRSVVAEFTNMEAAPSAITTARRFMRSLRFF